MKFWKNSKQNYSKDETEKAEMLEVHTRWLKGEQLSRKQKQLLRMSQERSDLEPLKQLIDFAHYSFRETESIVPRPGTKQRIANKLMKKIGDAAVEEPSSPRRVPVLEPAYVIDHGSESELAFPPDSTDLPPPSQAVEPSSEMAFLDGEAVEQAVAPSMEKACNLRLRIVQGDEVGREYDIAFIQMVVGHGVAATIPLDANAAVSRRHAMLTVDGNGVFITDLGSDSGTYVDGIRLTKPTPLYVASKVTIGNQSLQATEIQRDVDVLRLSFKVIEGSHVGQVYTVYAKEMTVGRGKDAQIRFADATGTLSRLHARFDLKDSKVYVTDLGSKNGTYVDEFCMEEPTIVQTGAIIRFGGVSCEVVDIEYT